MVNKIYGSLFRFSVVYLGVFIKIILDIFSKYTGLNFFFGNLNFGLGFGGRCVYNGYFFK